MLYFILCAIYLFSYSYYFLNKNSKINIKYFNKIKLLEGLDEIYSKEEIKDNDSIFKNSILITLENKNKSVYNK